MLVDIQLHVYPTVSIYRAISDRSTLFSVYLHEPNHTLMVSWKFSSFSFANLVYSAIDLISPSKAL